MLLYCEMTNFQNNVAHLLSWSAMIHSGNKNGMKETDGCLKTPAHTLTTI